jgi:hypothetical protein
MWSGGCQSFVAILIAKGSERREFTMGAIERPSATAREPFGGQKSSWKSTIIRAGVNVMASLFFLKW